MALIHVREKDKKNKTVNCIFHFIVPATQSAVGINWNEVIQKAKNPVPMMDDNDETENAEISAGNVLEIAETVRFSSIYLTNVERLAQIQAAYAAKQVEVFSDLSAELDFFGKEI